MAIKKYKTTKGLRYLVEVYEDGVRTAYRGGFKTKLEAHQWESTAKNSQPRQPDLGLSEVVTLFLISREPRIAVRLTDKKKVQNLKGVWYKEFTKQLATQGDFGLESPYHTLLPDAIPDSQTCFPETRKPA